MRAYEPSDAEAVLAINAESEPEVGPLDREKLEFFAQNASLILIAEARDFAGAGQVAEPGEDDEPVELDEDPTVLGFLIGLDETVTGYDSNNYAWFKERFPSFGYVDRVAVSTDARGKGLGPAMYRAMEAWAIGFGKGWVLAEVNTVPDNPHSHHFHQKAGFEECGRGNPYGNDQEVAYYEKQL